VDVIPQPLDCAAVRWESPDALDNYAFSFAPGSPAFRASEFLLREIRGDIQPSLAFDD